MMSTFVASTRWHVSRPSPLRMPVILPKQWLPREFSNKTFGTTPTRLAP